MKIIAGVIALLLLFVADAPSVLDTRVGDDVRITSPVDGDVYIIGRNIVIDAPVHGDVVAAGGTVVINDSVTMDVLVAGGRVEVNGPVTDDIRVAGGTVKVSGLVDGDVMATGGELILSTTAVLNGNIDASGGSLDIAGDIKGNVRAFADQLNLRGDIKGFLEAKAREIGISGNVSGPASIAASTINISPAATFSNDIRFWNDDGSLAISDQAHKGSITYDPSLEVARPRPELLGFSSVLLLAWYLGTALIMIWLIEYLFSNTFRKAAAAVLNHSLKSLAFGFLYFVAVPAACVLLAITVLGLPIGILGMIAYIVLIVLATVITAIIVANWINAVYYKSSWRLPAIVFTAFGIFVALKLITLTPIVGPMIIALMVCMAFGAIILSLRQKEPA
jgi:cytoskeletal protein CcmA (bactofilin family)